MNNKLYTKAYVEKAKEDDISLINVAVASTGIIDRYGEIIDPEGWDLKFFKKNPQFLWAHNSRELPIGKVVKIWTEGADAKAKLMFSAQFDMEDEFAVKVANKFAKGYLNAFSVGFAPKDWEIQEKTVEGETKRVLVYTKSELLEISAVSVPANPEALKKYYDNEKDTDVEFKNWSETVIDLEAKEKELQETKQELSECQLKNKDNENKKEAQENKHDELSETVKAIKDKVDCMSNEFKQFKENTVTVAKPSKKDEYAIKELMTVMKILDGALSVTFSQLKNSKKKEV